MLSQSTLTLTRLNELIQENRDSIKMLEPLFKTFIVLGSSIHIDAEECCNDILSLLNSQVCSTRPTDAKSSQFLRVCLTTLNLLQPKFLKANAVIESLVNDLFAKLSGLVPN